jgi:hypothetical protein
MKDANSVKLLRVSFWIAAILDGVYSLNISLVWLIDGFSGFDPIRMIRFTSGLESRYAWGMVFALMISWTILMIWADRRPLERKDTIMLTAFPLVTVLLIDTLFAIAVGLVTLIDILAIQLVYIFLIALFTSSYYLTRNNEQT